MRNILLLLFLTVGVFYTYLYITDTAKYHPVVISPEISAVQVAEVLNAINIPDVVPPSKGSVIQGYTEYKYPGIIFDKWIYISAEESTLSIIENGEIIKSYPVSLAKKGLGNKIDSNKTPLGLHEIKDMIGGDLPINAILDERIYTGKEAEIISEPVESNNDLVTSRIMWLSGLEDGYNKGGSVDSHDRLIYIHGTQEEGLIGSPASHGCIRMYNKDVIDLFNQVTSGTKVVIAE